MLIDHLTAGFALDEFLETVPSLDRTQAQRFLELAGGCGAEKGILAGRLARAQAQLIPIAPLD
jgi:hypothetical protein